MRIITCNLPVSFIEAIDKLTGRTGLYPSRSELIRVAVRQWLLKEIDDAKQFEQFSTAFKQHIPEQKPDPNKLYMEDGSVYTLKPRGIVQYHDDPHHPSNWCLKCGLYYCWHEECSSHEADPFGRAQGHKFDPDVEGKMLGGIMPPEERGGW